MIVLTGVPRAGKTTLGRLLAENLQVPFYDLDDVVVTNAARENSKIDSPKMIVKLYGEEILRSIEIEELRKLSTKSQGVLALGGGTLLGEVPFSKKPKDWMYFHLSISFELFLERILQKGLPMTCNMDLGWYEGLVHFYQARHDASLKLATHRIDVTSYSLQEAFLRVLDSPHLAGAISNNLRSYGGDHGE